MDFKLPNLGEGVDSGEVVGLPVKVGDTVAKGQSLAEVETNKAVMDVTANFSGRLTAVNVKPGDKVKPGQVLVAYEAAAGAVPTAAPAPVTAGAPAPQAPLPASATVPAGAPAVAVAAPSASPVSR